MDTRTAATAMGREVDRARPRRRLWRASRATVAGDAAAGDPVPELELGLLPLPDPGRRAPRIGRDDRPGAQHHPFWPVDDALLRRPCGDVRAPPGTPRGGGTGAHLH